MLSAKLLSLALPLLSLLDAGVLASNGPGGSQIPLDSTSSITAPPSYHIHPGYNHPSKCLDVKGAVFADGTPVQMIGNSKEEAPKSEWRNRISAWTPATVGVISSVSFFPGRFTILCVAPFKDGTKVKIWECFNIPAQQWYYTDDDRIALEGQGFCLDLTDGKLSNENPIQIWTCTDNNANQVWSATL
ncbi:hypothetical protein MD484_g4622, partial [Candolleomyces efflorescens]